MGYTEVVIKEGTEGIRYEIGTLNNHSNSGNPPGKVIWICQIPTFHESLQEKFGRIGRFIF